jgi:hypothetical protein
VVSSALLARAFASIVALSSAGVAADFSASVAGNFAFDGLDLKSIRSFR